ncbi:L-rhamnose isomerase, partial [Sodalis-like symbiont of Bactericera trigonica]
MNPALEQAWQLARQRYADIDVDVEQALTLLDPLPVSMNCWQGDDVAGFEDPSGALTGGVQATGNYPGKATNPEQLRADLEQAFSLIPGPKRLNLHAIYLEAEQPVARNAIEPAHFSRWVAWAREHQLGLDFNPTCFSYPLSADSFTLSHADDNIRQFWIEHCQASRRISAYFSRELGTASVMNIWVPDRLKDLTVGSAAFYLAYATSRGTALCMDAGHFHPTEVIS